ncbi:hypothetical protein D3C81_591960 [compost metagenome]
MDSQRAALETVVLDAVEERVVDKQRLALGTGDHAFARAPVTNLRDQIVPEGGIGDVVHQDPVVLILLGTIADHGQLATLHECITGAGAAGQVADHPVVVGKHVMNAVAQIFQLIAFEAVAVGGIDIDAITGVAYPITDDPRPVHGIEMNAIATILRTQSQLSLDHVIQQADVARAIHPDPAGRSLHPIGLHLGVTGFPLDEDSGIELGEVATPVDQSTALHRHVRRRDGEGIALPFSIDHRPRLATEHQGFFNTKLPPVLSGRQTPTRLSIGLQGQGTNGLRCRKGRTNAAASQHQQRNSAPGLPWQGR